MNPLKKAVSLYKNSPKLAKFRYTAYYEKLSVSEDTILIECFNGDGITGNPFWLLKEICADSRLSEYRIFVAANPKYFHSVCHALKKHGMSRAKAVVKYDKLYLKLLASAKYLITNVSFPLFFIKKPGQILLDTWHGTPLKGLGRSIRDNPHTIGNVQRIFLMSDYLLYPNRFTFDKMREDYMIAPFFKGKYVISGYPRNDILFDHQAAASVREQLGLSEKRVAVFMPTWKECNGEDEERYHSRMLTDALEALDRSADDHVVVIAKLHHLAAGSIDFSAYRRVIPFPADFETYEVLAAADCLITDYSSVLFDFADTGRKIILYAYDSQQYQNTRSMYFPIEELPFPIVTDPMSLVDEVNSPAFPPYSDIMEKFTGYDCPDSAKKLVGLVFFGRQSEGMEVIDGSAFHNGRPNLLIYAGNLMKNGITTALMGILENTDTTRYNYLLTFYQKLVQSSIGAVNRFGRDIGYLPMPAGKPVTYYEAICQYLYFHMNWDFGFIRRAVERLSRRDLLRCFCGIDFHAVIHYTGYEKFVIHLLNSADAKRIIYVHNDIMQESKNRSRTSVHRHSLMTAYNGFEKIAVVRESMVSEIKRYIPTAPESRICAAHNLNNIGYILKRAEEPVAFDEDTYCNMSPERVREILADENVVKFIDIARYYVEKGLDRLVEAFQTLSSERGDVCLIIIGGHGDQFDNICAQVKATGLDNIIIIRSLSNPYPILKACNAFILPSIYEGLPMVIMEALILGKPVVSTDIPGPGEFLRSNGCGLLVESSTQGVLDGMRAYFDGRLHSLRPFDAQAFNEKALAEFYELIE